MKKAVLLLLILFAFSVCTAAYGEETDKDKPDLNFSLAYEKIKGDKSLRMDFGLADNWNWLYYQVAFRGDWSKNQKGYNGSAAIGVRQGMLGFYGFVDGLYQQDIGFHAQAGPTVIVSTNNFSLTGFYRFPLTGRVLDNMIELDPRPWRDETGYYIRTGMLSEYSRAISNWGGEVIYVPASFVRLYASGLWAEHDIGRYELGGEVRVYGPLVFKVGYSWLHNQDIVASIWSGADGFWAGLSLILGSQESFYLKERKFVTPTYPIVIRESEETFKDTKIADNLSIAIHSDRTSGIVNDWIHFWATVEGGCTPYKEFRWVIIGDKSREEFVTSVPEFDYQFRNPGVDCVRVAVIDDCGYEKSSDCLQITIEKPAPAELEAGAREYCEKNVLWWKGKNATRVEIDQGIGTVKSSGELDLNNRKRMTYTITAWNAGGDKVQKRVTVRGVPQPGRAVFKFYRLSGYVQGDISIMCNSYVSWSVRGPCDVSKGQNNVRVTTSHWSKEVDIMGLDNLSFTVENSLGYTVRMEIWINGSVVEHRDVRSGTTGYLSYTFRTD